jgi:hypothetical protein
MRHVIRPAHEAFHQINPNQRLVRLLNFALDGVIEKICHQPKYEKWLKWASEWKSGQYSPQQCVDISHLCRDGRDKIDLMVWGPLAQLAWAAKEACYSTPKGGWYVLFYIADAMIAFGVAFPDDTSLLRLDAPTEDAKPIAGEITLDGED